jgi:hypothetical protein
VVFGGRLGIVVFGRRMQQVAPECIRHCGFWQEIGYCGFWQEIAAGSAGVHQAIVVFGGRLGIVVFGRRLQQVAQECVRCYLGR